MRAPKLFCPTCGMLYARSVERMDGLILERRECACNREIVPDGPAGTVNAEMPEWVQDILTGP